MNVDLVTFWIRDFIILKGLNQSNYLPIGFHKSLIGKSTLLLYQKSDIHTHCTLKLYDEKLEIQWENSFYPLFHYKNGVTEIITPNYSHLYNLHISLTNNTVGIKEFILFNTALTQNTFHNEVKRLAGIEKIILENNEIKFLYRTDVNVKDSIEKIFEKEVERISEISKAYHHAVFLSGGSESRINAAITTHYKFNKEFITWGHPEDKEYIIATRIAEKLKIKLVNIRPKASDLPYKEILEKTGFLSNMQFAYRYEVIKQIFETGKYDIAWTGWGDINGYPTMYQPSELFANFYLGLYKSEYRYPKGWNIDWLKEYERNKNIVVEKVKSKPNLNTFFELKDKILSPFIYGQVLAVENLNGYVFAPWFCADIYERIRKEEEINLELITNKRKRTQWKNNLYYNLIKKYYPKLNFVKNAKGYYPWMITKQMGTTGLALAAALKKFESLNKYPFDSVEDKNFIKTELENAAESGLEIFNKNNIYEIIKKSDYWRGNDILEYFKIIQVNWFLKREQ